MLLGTPSWIFSQEKATGSSHLNLVAELIDNNLGYSRKVSSDDIIKWENEIVSIFQKEKDYERMFIMKQW